MCVTVTNDLTNPSPIRENGNCRDRVALYCVVLGAVFALVATGGWSAISKYRTWGSAVVLKDLSPTVSCNSCGGNPTSPSAFLSNFTWGMFRAVESVNPIYRPCFPLGSQFIYTFGQRPLPSASARSLAKSPASLSSGLRQTAIGVGMAERASPSSRFCFSVSRLAPVSFLSSKRSALAASASILASLADCAAEPASCVINASNWSLSALSSLVFERNWLLIDANSLLPQASPRTPSRTTTVAMMSNQNLHRGGRPGGLTTFQTHNLSPIDQSCTSSRYSETITMTSPTIPKKTANEETIAKCSQKEEDPSSAFMQLSSAAMELRKADMDASRAEASLGKAEGAVANSCMIAAIATLFFLFVMVLVLLRSRKF